MIRRFIVNKAFLKWAGGKSKLLPTILNEIGTVKGTYIEPFVGSGVVSFNVEAANYIVSDINKDLINTYNQIKTHGDLFIQYCSLLFEEEFRNESSFYKLRERFNTTTKDLEKAAIFIYLNRNSFNGLCRYNQKGIFNTPFGRYKTVYFPEKELSWFYNNCQKYTFTVSSFESIIANAGKDDVVYADPPYVPLSDSAYFTAYSKEVFGFNEQKSLAKLAEESKSRVILSNHATEFTRELYKNADKLIELDVTRSISAKSDGRKKVRELLAIYKEN